MTPCWSFSPKEENDHAGQRSPSRTHIQASALEQGQADRSQAAATAKARLVVWSIRTKLQIADRKRDLAMFNLAIDSSCAVAMSSPSRWRTLPRMATPSSVRRCARRRPACRYGSRSPSKPGRLSMTTSVPTTESPATFCSLRRAGRRILVVAWSKDKAGYHRRRCRYVAG